MGLTRTALTPTDLMTMPPLEGSSGYELSDGELIVLGNAGRRHELIQSRIAEALILWKVQYGLARVFSESMFSLGEQTARIPDVSVLLGNKIRMLPDEDVPFPFGPDVAVEVISASESVRDSEKKVREYFTGGAEEVWQVYPDRRAVRVRRIDGSQEYSGDAILRSAVLPGFEARVSTFFVD